jgi:hypothetical protein
MYDHHGLSLYSYTSIIIYIMDLTPVDKDYEARMLAFEVDCFDGKGEPIACHRVGEYYSVVANDHIKAAKVYQDNCTIKNYSPSCFNLGRLFCKFP